MKDVKLESGRRLREDGKYNQRKEFGMQKKTTVADYQDFQIEGMQIKDRLPWCIAKKYNNTCNQGRSICI